MASQRTVGASIDHNWADPRPIIILVAEELVGIYTLPQFLREITIDGLIHVYDGEVLPHTDLYLKEIYQVNLTPFSVTAEQEEPYVDDDGEKILRAKIFFNHADGKKIRHFHAVGVEVIDHTNTNENDAEPGRTGENSG